MTCLDLRIGLKLSATFINAGIIVVPLLIPIVFSNVILTITTF